MRKLLNYLLFILKEYRLVMDKVWFQIVIKKMHVCTFQGKIVAILRMMTSQIDALGLINHYMLEFKITINKA